MDLPIIINWTSLFPVLLVADIDFYNVLIEIRVGKQYKLSSDAIVCVAYDLGPRCWHMSQSRALGVNGLI